jgi:hypothetical protein
MTGEQETRKISGWQAGENHAGTRIRGSEERGKARDGSGEEEIECAGLLEVAWSEARARAGMHAHAGGSAVENARKHTGGFPAGFSR